MGIGSSNFDLCQGEEDPKPCHGDSAFGYVSRNF